MASPALDYTYRYRFASTVETASDGPKLHLATSGGAEEHPYFFKGQLRQPQRAADLLRSLMDIVHARFHLPGIIVRRFTDPVVTCSEGALRFEGFSSCGSAYARVDLLPESLAGDVMGRGTTNVDFNPPMCAALARLRSGDRAGLTVGGDGVELTRNNEAIEERKVALPLRWLKGFVEVQAYAARMQRRLEIPGTEAHRFFRALPRANMKLAWVIPAGNGLRISQRETRAAVRVTGTERMRTLENLARHARTMRVYCDAATGASGWEMALPDCNFHLLLSPEVWRGFSGEGQALNDLAGQDWQDALPRVRAALTWDTVIDSAALATKLKSPPEIVTAALSVLGARGLVGYDLASQCYFQRVLPFDLSLVESLHPRLQDARKLVAAGGIRVLSSAGEQIEAIVPGTGIEHRVRITEEGSRCSCPWFAKHQGTRGPCKHVLAVQIVTDEEQSPQ